MKTAPRIFPGPLNWRWARWPRFRASRSLFAPAPGMGWYEHDDGVFHGCEKFFRPGYAANLVSSWIPALGGVKEKLERGGKVADVGCGKGASTVLMAKAFPKSRFHGFDYHEKSIEGARESAKREGVSERAHVRSGGGEVLSGQRLRSRGGLRLPARYGRPGRGGQTHPGIAEARMAVG